MKKVISVFLLIGVLLILGAKKQSCNGDQMCKCMSVNTVEAKKAILKAHDAIIAAAEKRDMKTMFEYFLENDMGVIAQNGQLMLRQEALKQMQQNMMRVTDIKYDFKQRNIKMLSPQCALMTAAGTTTSTIDTGKSFTSEFANTSVFVLEKDSWKIIHGHHSIKPTNMPLN